MKNISAEPPRRKRGMISMDDDVYGVRATIIDLGLARMDSHEHDRAAVHWTTFEPEVFEGEGISR